MSAKIVTIVQGQSIWDIAIQEYGSVTSVFDFIDDNAFADGLDTLLTPGQKVKIISTPSDMGVLTYIQANNITVVGGRFLSEILAYAYGSQPVAVVNNGGDNWTFNAPLTPITYVGGLSIGYAKVSIEFYQSGSGTTLVNDSRINASASFNYSGLGAGTYMGAVDYYSPDGVVVFVTTCYVMVDGAGNVIRQANFNGIANVVVAEMNISADALAVLNNCTAAYSFLWLNLVGNQPLAEGPLASTGLSVSDIIPSYHEVGVILVALLDPTEWTDAGAHINSFLGQTGLVFITNN